MKAVLRVASALSILGFVALMALRDPAMRSAVNSSALLTAVVNVGGAVAALASFTAWFGSIYHWGTAFPVTAKSRRAWGLVVILGVFIGAWLYSFVGIRSVKSAADVH